MTHNEAKTFLEDLAGVVRSSRIGEQHAEFICGLINTVIYYLPSCFTLLPTVAEKEE